METVETTPAPWGRRERKKLETRRTIRREALNLALELGMEHLTVEAITEAADVSVRTFFNYFACKEDALVTDAAEAAETMRPQIVDRPVEESPLRALRETVLESDFLAAARADRGRVLARQRLVQEHQALRSRQLAKYASLERAMAEALAERLGVDPDQDLRPALIAGVSVSVVRVAVRRWAADGTEPLDELIALGFDLLEQGVLTEAPHPVAT